MNKRHILSLLLPLLALSSVQAAATDSDFAQLPPLSPKRLSGSLTAGVQNCYVGRGIAATREIVGGSGAEMGAIKMKYDFGEKSGWSWDSAMVYTAVSSGHTMYGNPMFSPTYRQAASLYERVEQALTVMPPTTSSGYPSPVDGHIMTLGEAKAYLESKGMNDKVKKIIQSRGGHIKEANVENEFVVQNALHYTRQYWNIACGHTFIHGGMLGVMAKHYRDQGASCVNEVYLRPEFTPWSWVSVGCDVRFSCQGITGWWFVPDVTFKAPIIGTPEDIKLAGVLQFGMSVAADYYAQPYFACNNGTQGLWIKFSVPWFVRKDVVVTPWVQFDWLGKGAEYANTVSEFRKYSGNDNLQPMADYRIIYGVMVSYLF